ncbi:MAG TPA: 3-dehydroquinate synthase [Bacillaceae bacterium]
MNIMVKTSSKTYPVMIGPQVIDELAKLIRENQYTKLLVISDQTVSRLHLDTLIQSLPAEVETDHTIVHSGEMAKQFSVYEHCLSYALERGLDRKSCILAFGGGAVGDLSGFVAATYMRGIPFIQVPTTILAHDSAVGGKTAINLPEAKNMVGAFHQPDAVIYDTDFLTTLPEQEVRSGFAEAVKHALIADAGLLDYIMEHIHSIEDVSGKRLQYILAKGVQIKAGIVEKDEKEAGLRAVLNFGHTLGHVIEAAGGYGKVTHGESVMTGMVYALMLSIELEGLDFPLKKYVEWSERLGYRFYVPENLAFDTVMSAMRKDKKSHAGTPRFVLLESVGQPVIREVEAALLETVYQKIKKRMFS